MGDQDPHGRDVPAARPPGRHAKEHHRSVLQGVPAHDMGSPEKVDQRLDQQGGLLPRKRERGRAVERKRKRGWARAAVERKHERGRARSGGVRTRHRAHRPVRSSLQTAHPDPRLFFGIAAQINTANIKFLIPELFAENLVRGRGLFARSVMRAQSASVIFTSVYAALVAIINTKMPANGELVVKRLMVRSCRRAPGPRLRA